MSSAKETTVDDGPIPFGNSGQPNGSQQGFFGSQVNPQLQQQPQQQQQQQQQQYHHHQQQQTPLDTATGGQGAAPSSSSSVLGSQQPVSTSGNVIYRTQQTQLHQLPVNGNGFFEQYQGTNAPPSHGIAQQKPQQQQQGATLTQPYDPSLYQTHQHYAESVVSSDMVYQQQYQSFDQAQQQYQQQYDYGQQQYDYSQQNYAYTEPQQQQYDYSQQQQQYDYNQQAQFDYGQQQYDYSQQQPYDVSQQPYDVSQQQQYDPSQQQQYDASQQQQYDASQQQQYDVSQQQQYDVSQQQQYDTSQQQQYDVNQQQQYDVSQQQQYDVSQQQQYDVSQQQQYDTSQQQQYDTSQQQQYDVNQHQEPSHDSNQQQVSDATLQQQSNQDKTQQQQHDLSQQFDATQQYDASHQYGTSQQNDQSDRPLMHEPQSNEKFVPLMPEPGANAVNWGEWDDQQVPEKDDQQNNSQSHEHTKVAQSQQPLQQQQQLDDQAQANVNFESQLKEDIPPSQKQEQHDDVQQVAPDHSQPIYEYEDKEGYQHVDIQPPGELYGSEQIQVVTNQPSEQSLRQHSSATDNQQERHQPNTSATIQAHSDGNETIKNALGVQHEHITQNYGVSTPIMSSRINSPQPDPVAMVPCPDPNCEGENKPKAKFCSECGRPLFNISRTSTPAMAPFSPQFNPYMTSPSYAMHQQPQQFYYGQQANQPYYDPTAQQGKLVPAPDPLQRNKGCPLATFGFGGKLCLMFPNKLNIQDANARIIPGLVQVTQVKEVTLPSVTPLSDFVGPVLLDSSVDVATKKQDAIAYMDRRVDGFCTQLQTLAQGSSEYYRLENKVLLWQLVKLLIQEDFAGDSDRKDAAMRLLLQPEEFVVEGDTLAMMRKHLLEGDRSSALQYAMQENMWAHGLIIGKSVGQSSWKAVVDRFLEQSLSTLENEHTGLYQNASGDHASLRVLYALFAGSGDAVSHFIPKYSPKSMEQQLSEWRETVALILANRAEESNELIKKLGDLLKKYGWIDAADICYAVSSNEPRLSNDDLLDIGLLGSQDGDIAASLDSLYLTELYEFALSLDQQSNITILPFLQGYKLVHAWWLADTGYVQEASRYLQAIVSGLLSYNKPSPYMHRGFLDNLKEFNNLCRGSMDASIGNDLDLSLQQLEIKLNNGTEVSQRHTTTDTMEPSSYQQTAELQQGTGDYEQKEQQKSEGQGEPTSSGYEAVGIGGAQTMYTNDNNDYTTQYQYDQDEDQYGQQNQRQQEDYSQNYDAYPSQQENECHTEDHFSSGNDVETAEYSHHDSSAQSAYDYSLNSNVAPPVPNISSIEEPASQQENQPPMPAYNPHNAGDYTTNYDAQEYTESRTTLDTSNAYLAQDYTSTYQVHGYTTTYETQEYATSYGAQDATQELTNDANNGGLQGTIPIPAHDIIQEGASPNDIPNAAQKVSQTTYDGENLTQDYTTTYGATSTISDTTLPQDHATPQDAQYPAVTDSSLNHDHASPYEPDASSGLYGSESAEVSTYNQEYTSSLYGPEQSSLNDDGGDSGNPKSNVLDDDDMLGLGNSSTKKAAQLDAKSDDEKHEHTTADTSKDNKTTDDEDDDDDKQDRKGWGLFSMFSRASPAPMEKDEKKAVKANLGETSSFYFDEKEGRWVNKNVSDTPAAPAKLPPPPKSSLPKPSTPQPSAPTTVAASTDDSSASSPTAPPLKATTAAPNHDGPRPPLSDMSNTGPPNMAARRGPASGKKKPMRSRYIDVFNTPTPP